MTTPVTIRDERRGDEAAIRELTRVAFDGKPYSDGSEPAIVDRLRASGALAVSLVAASDGRVVGHVAFSRVIMSDAVGAWYALGPISVEPALQRRGIGSRLVNEGVERIRALGAAGCVLAGDPRYYGRFGFIHDPAITLDGIPAHASLVRRLQPGGDTGFVRFDEAFSPR